MQKKGGGKHFLYQAQKNTNRAKEKKIDKFNYIKINVHFIKRVCLTN